MPLGQERAEHPQPGRGERMRILQLCWLVFDVACFIVAFACGRRFGWMSQTPHHNFHPQVSSFKSCWLPEIHFVYGRLAFPVLRLPRLLNTRSDRKPWPMAEKLQALRCAGVSCREPPKSIGFPSGFPRSTPPKTGMIKLHESRVTPLAGPPSPPGSLRWKLWCSCECPAA